MPKNAVAISDDIHMMISKKKLEIKEKYGLKFDMQDIADAVIEKGFEVFDIEELLGIDKEKYEIIERENKIEISLVDPREVAS